MSVPKEHCPDGGDYPVDGDRLIPGEAHTIAVDIVEHGAPVDVSRWAWDMHVRRGDAVILTPDVTVTHPHDSDQPCRLHIELTAGDTTGLADGDTLHLEQTQPHRRTWWQPRLRIAAADPDAIVLSAIGGRVAIGHSPNRPATAEGRSVGAEAVRVGPKARRPFADLTQFPPLRYPNANTLRRRHALVAQAYPSVTADAHDWLTDDIVARLMLDFVRHAQPHTSNGPRPTPTQDELRDGFAELLEKARPLPPEPRRISETVKVGPPRPELEPNGPGCSSCARIDRWEPPFRKSPTTLNGLLPTALWLCEWCHTRTRHWGQLPSPDEVRAHHDGCRVARPADIRNQRQVGRKLKLKTVKVGPARREEEPDGPGCASCAGIGRWERPDPRWKNPTRLGKRLPRPMRLCAWCADRVRHWGRLPHTDELQAHHDGYRVARPPDVD